MVLTLVVGLMLGGIVVYVAYRDQKLGAALAVGAAVVVLFYSVIDKEQQPPAPPQTDPPASSLPTPVPVPTQSLPSGQPTP
ncbi:hypothetical protein [Streptomyces sp. NPDC048508]|uniref:hypothetical protein n=1 Tax=Streptomyces sp. NPDC048508 TaxID=3365561 RepID=UPI003722492C